MIFLTPKPSQVSLTTVYKVKNNILFTEKEVFKEKGEWKIEQKTKRRLFNNFQYDD